MSQSTQRLLQQTTISLPFSNNWSSLVSVNTKLTKDLLGDDTEDEDSTNNTESITMDEIDLHMEKYDKLRSAGKEPGLTIIQYLRESESRYYDYFSMKNKDEVDKRINEARVKSLRAEEVGMQSELTTCQFCGKTIPKMSLLQVIQEDNEEHITDKKVNVGSIYMTCDVIS